jgi:UDP-N-acetylmuramoyl-tripeptide--D-alanyl-D-alanine ligase
MLKILMIKLKILAKLTVRKYQPRIIGITGSVGKTSAKEAIYSVLANHFRVRRNVKNYNNEIGVPLTVLGFTDSPGKNILKWFWYFLIATKNLIIKNKKYPEILILEMGADKPGDISYLTNIAKPNIAMITAIGHSHIEAFGSIKNILNEKSKILDKLDKNDWAVLNFDDANLSNGIKNYDGKIKTFGQNKDADVYIYNIQIVKRNDTYGIVFKLSHQGSETPIWLPNVLGWQHAVAAAAAAAVGLTLDMNLVEIGKALVSYHPARGRMRVLPGVKKSWLIDDTYNASPESSAAALEILAQMPVQGRKIAVFGDMLELGSHTEAGHNQVGKKLAELKIDYLFVIGEKSRDIARGAKEAGMSEDHIFHFPFTMEAGVFLQERMKENDIILIKGSRGSKMEQVVYEVMARPWDANDLLVGPVEK